MNYSRIISFSYYTRLYFCGPRYIDITAIIRGLRFSVELSDTQSGLEMDYL